MGKFSFSTFVYEQLSRVPPVEKVDLTGKTVMVIGANTGLGFEAAKHFAGMNPARVILACRSKSKGEAALERLQRETGYEKGELWLVDLSDFSSVIAFSDKFVKEGGRLDILVENAAIATLDHTLTDDGFESSLQVNCLSPALLALRLLPQMIKTAEDHSTYTRLVIVTSEVHFWSTIPQDVWDSDSIYKTMSSKDFPMQGRYQDSKLLDVFLYQALNERLGPKSRVIVDGVNPGLCHSELTRKATGLVAFRFWLFKKVLARTAEQGGRQLVYAALGGADNLDKFRGAYISSTSVSEASDFAIGEEGHAIQDKHWNEVIEILSKVDHHIPEVVNKYLVKRS
ncbi:hypothetical protein H0H92_008811 [Tricholoma furcatifolium]|nr:hypothetical protein H0H92_008811 [Tricholoma furcatifolium]